MNRRQQSGSPENHKGFLRKEAQYCKLDFILHSDHLMSHCLAADLFSDPLTWNTQKWLTSEFQGI